MTSAECKRLINGSLGNSHSSTATCLRMYLQTAGTDSATFQVSMDTLKVIFINHEQPEELS